MALEMRRVKYLNNVIEQDHRFIKKKVRASQCFKRFHAAERTLEGIEAMNMIRKGQVKAKRERSNRAGEICRELLQYRRVVGCRSWPWHALNQFSQHCPMGKLDASRANATKFGAVSLGIT